MNVLVIAEDFRKDQHIVRPIVRRMLTEVGKPKANVRVCRDPLMGGVTEALKWERIKEVLQRYRMVQLFLLLLDRDGVEGRRKSLDALEKKARGELGSVKVLFGENAWQEIEVWALAGQDLPAKWRWGTIRAEVNPQGALFRAFRAAAWSAKRAWRGAQDDGPRSRPTIRPRAVAM